MAQQTIGIIVNGATGRIAATQHLANALVPIIREGGLPIGDERWLPNLLLVGRNADRVGAIARTHAIADWSTDLDAALASREHTIFFDAAATGQRVHAVEKAIGAGKHVYCEKPLAPSLAEAHALLQKMQARGCKHGVVEDKIHLPGLAKLAALTRSGALGRLAGFRLDFGWWVFDGMERPCQRPSWNYRAEGGGLVLDMYPHWRYLIETAVGRIVRVASTAWTAVPERVDEQRERYGVKVEDSAATLVEVEGRIFGTIMSSWATRVRRDDLLTLQVDGTQATAIAGLHRCHVQSNVQTPDIAHFSVMKDLAIDYRGGWAQAPPLTSYCNPYRVGWEQFLRHVATGAPMVSDFSAGVRDVAFASAPGWRCPVSRRGGFQTRPPSAGAVYDAQSPTLTSNLAEDRVCCLRPL